MNKKELHMGYLNRVGHPFVEVANEAAEKYIEIWNSTRVDGDNHLYEGLRFKDCCNTSVELTGEEYWRYGGYESHTEFMPIRFALCEDGSTFEEFRIEREARKAGLEKEEYERRQQAKRGTYERLKQEFGE